MNTKVSASILSADFGRLEYELKRSEEAGCDMIHFDVMDGHFVPNLSYGVPVLKSIRKYCRLPFDVHLMITDPLMYIEPFADAGADHITFHEEISGGKDAVISKIHSLGLTAGLSVRPKTPIERVFPYLDRLSMVLVMTVEPGFGGQHIIPETLEKVSRLREETDRRGLRGYKIEVDGGIRADNIRSAVDAGANVIVTGSAVFGEPDIPGAIKRLREAATN